MAGHGVYDIDKLTLIARFDCDTVPFGIVEMQGLFNSNGRYEWEPDGYVIHEYILNLEDWDKFLDLNDLYVSDFETTDDIEAKNFDLGYYFTEIEREAIKGMIEFEPDGKCIDFWIYKDFYKEDLIFPNDVVDDTPALEKNDDCCYRCGAGPVTLNNDSEIDDNWYCEECYAVVIQEWADRQNNIFVCPECGTDTSHDESPDGIVCEDCFDKVNEQAIELEESTAKVTVTNADWECMKCKGKFEEVWSDGLCDECHAAEAIEDANFNTAQANGICHVCLDRPVNDYEKVKCYTCGKADASRISYSNAVACKHCGDKHFRLIQCSKGLYCIDCYKSLSAIWTWSDRSANSGETPENVWDSEQPKKIGDCCKCNKELFEGNKYTNYCMDCISRENAK